MPRRPDFLAVLLGFWLCICAPLALALGLETPLPGSADEARAEMLFSEIRCVVCHGETIADSPADIAHDMRVDIRARIAKGDSNDAILSDIVARYGDTILMRPPLKQSTLLLWFGPLLILGSGLLLVRRLFRKSAV